MGDETVAPSELPELLAVFPDTAFAARSGLSIAEMQLTAARRRVLAGFQLLCSACNDLVSLRLGSGLSRNRKE